MNGKPREAWELYLKTNNHDSFNFLVLVANDCYRAGAFYYAAKVCRGTLFEFRRPFGSHGPDYPLVTGFRCVRTTRFNLRALGGQTRCLLRSIPASNRAARKEGRGNGVLLIAY